jgi:hypothetical protein
MKKVIGNKTPMSGKKTMRAANSIMGKEKPMVKKSNCDKR